MEKKPKKKKLSALSIKVPENILRQLHLNAEKYAQGNMSAWLRHAGLYHKPKDGERVVIPKTIPDFF